MSAAFPPVGLFESVADPNDLEDVLSVEALTDPQIRDAVGNLALVPPEERVTGAGSSDAMTPFTHPPDGGGRFNDPGVGAWHAARDRRTAIAETVFHRERVLRASGAPSGEVSVRVLGADVDAMVNDVREGLGSYPDVHDPDPSNYEPARSLARKLRAGGANGIVYDSVRHDGGQCVVLFSPKHVRLPVREISRLRYVWNGRSNTIEHVYEVGPVETPARPGGE